MIAVYIWGPELTACSAGHAAASVGDIHISVWPADVAHDLSAFSQDDETWIARLSSPHKKGFALAKDLDADRIMMQRDFDDYYLINGLKENRALRKWREILASDRHYDVKYFNCCIPIAEMLYCANVFELTGMWSALKWHMAFPKVVEELNGFVDHARSLLNVIFNESLEQFDWEGNDCTFTPWFLRSLLDDLENYDAKHERGRFVVE